MEWNHGVKTGDKKEAVKKKKKKKEISNLFSPKPVLEKKQVTQSQIRQVLLC